MVECNFALHRYVIIVADAGFNLFEQIFSEKEHCLHDSMRSEQVCMSNGYIWSSIGQDNRDVILFNIKHGIITSDETKYKLIISTQKNETQCWFIAGPSSTTLAQN